tara:strand:- start:12639 stop:13046 length:408 start_codon:yes stop_codon:yes gene_type:complete
MSDSDQRLIAVFHVDPFTGILFEPTPPFTHYNTVPNRNCVHFDSAADAIKYCQNTIASHPHVQCVVNGLPIGTQCEFIDAAWLEAESNRRKVQNTLLANEMAHRHRRDRWWIMGFVVAILLGAVLYLLARFWRVS